MPLPRFGELRTLTHFSSSNRPFLAKFHRLTLSPKHMRSASNFASVVHLAFFAGGPVKSTEICALGALDDIVDDRAETVDVLVRFVEQSRELGLGLEPLEFG